MNAIDEYTLSQVADRIWTYIQSIVDIQYTYLMILIDEYGRFCYYHTNHDLGSKASLSFPVVFYQLERRDIKKYTYDVFREMFYERVMLFKRMGIVVTKHNKPMMFNNNQSFLLFHNGFVAKVDIDYILNKTEMFTVNEAHSRFLSLLSPEDMNFFLTNKPIGPLTTIKTKLHELGLWTPRESDEINLNTIVDLLNDIEYADRIYDTLKNIRISGFSVAINPTEFVPYTVVMEIYKKEGKIINIKLNGY